MPYEFTNSVISYEEKKKCFKLNKIQNYLISNNIGYCVIDYNKKNKNKIVCDDKNFKIDQLKFKYIVDKSFNK